MAKTTNQLIEIQGEGKLWPFPVYTGETIYKGCLAAVGANGYLYDMDAAAAKEARIIVIVADDSANATGPAATTASGSISGTREEKSAVAGDKTVRLCYIQGKVKLTFTAIAQSDVGKTVFATDNFTTDESQALGVKVGTLLTYIDGTTGWVDLNTFYQKDGAAMFKGNLTASTGTVGGSVMSWKNPTGETILIEELFIDITTGSTGAALIDFGVGSAAESKDTLIDGATSSLVRTKSIDIDHGTNGRHTKATSGQYVTGTATATLAGLVGTYTVIYRIFE
jgi:hypothetical protein